MHARLRPVGQAEDHVGCVLDLHADAGQRPRGRQDLDGLTQYPPNHVQIVIQRSHDAAAQVRAGGVAVAVVFPRMPARQVAPLPGVGVEDSPQPPCRDGIPQGAIERMVSEAVRHAADAADFPARRQQRPRFVQVAADGLLQKHTHPGSEASDGHRDMQPGGIGHDDRPGSIRQGGAQFRVDRDAVGTLERAGAPGTRPEQANVFSPDRPEVLKVPPPDRAVPDNQHPSVPWGHMLLLRTRLFLTGR